MAVGEASAVPNAVELLADAPGRVREVVDTGDDSCQERQDCGCSSSDKRDRRALTRRLFEFVGDQQAHAETHRRLRKRNDARDRKVVAEFIE